MAEDSTLEAQNKAASDTRSGRKGESLATSPSGTSMGSSTVLAAVPLARPYDGTLMGAALNNLGIAQQYIDEIRYTAEHRLISFHYGVAILAAYRNEKEKLAVAKQHLEAAVGWKITQDREESMQEAVDRIVCESHYNLGVIEELNKNFLEAQECYHQALQVSDKYAGDFDNVSILAELGSISVSMEIIRSQRKKANRASSADQQIKLTAEVAKDRIRVRNMIDALAKRVEEIRTAYSSKSFTTKSTAEPEFQPDTPRFLRRLFGGSPGPDGRKESQTTSKKSALGPYGILRQTETLSQILTKLEVFQSELG